MKNILIILLVLVLGYFGIHYIFDNFKSETISEKTAQNSNEKIEKIEKELKEKVEEKTEDLKEKLEKEKEKLTEEKEKTTIKIPSWDLDGSVTYTEHQVPKTLGVLDATYKKLFELNGDASAYEGFKYESVSLKDGVATVSLRGSFYPKGDLSAAYLKGNIAAAAFQFNTVDKIIVQVSGKTFDWCAFDESDGESGCPEEKQLWIVER